MCTSIPCSWLARQLEDWGLPPNYFGPRVHSRWMCQLFLWPNLMTHNFKFIQIHWKFQHRILLCFWVHPLQAVDTSRITQVQLLCELVCLRHKFPLIPQDSLKPHWFVRSSWISMVRSKIMQNSVRRPHKPCCGSAPFRRSPWRGLWKIEIGRVRLCPSLCYLCHPNPQMWPINL